MEIEIDCDRPPAACVAEASITAPPRLDRWQGRDCSVECSNAATPPGTLATDRLVRAVIMRGLILDHPWRHAYLRHRWTGVDGKGHPTRGD